MKLVLADFGEIVLLWGLWLTLLQLLVLLWSVDEALLEKVLQNRLSPEDALRFASSAPECVAFTLLALQQRIASTQQTAGAHTPSAAVPPYAKANMAATGAKSKSRRRKRGGQLGHAGRTREPLPEPDRIREHQLPRCPNCQGKLKRTGETRRRRSEDIPEDLKPVITEDVLHRDYCPQCRQRVEPKLHDVLPNCTLGNRTLVLSALLHFLQGLTVSQVVDTFNFHLRMKVTPGGLVQMWHRLADLLFAWYEQIQQESLQSATLHADETGWRVSGQTHWLWSEGARSFTAEFAVLRRGTDRSIRKRTVKCILQGALC